MSAIQPDPVSSDASQEAEWSKDSFLSQFAHDLRTPITHIVGYSEMLLEEIELSGDTAKRGLVPDLERIRAAGKDMLNFVSEDMNAARAANTELKVVLDQLRNHMRMPLDQVIGYSEILYKDLNGQSSLAGDLQKINAAGKRLTILISDGVELSRLVKGEPIPTRKRDTQPIAKVSDDETRSDKGYLLVVDDNEINRDMMSRRLRREGYSVALAENAQQALQLVKTQKFDLVLLDIMMPGISGLQMLSIIRETRSIVELPIILATAKDQTDDIVVGLQSGANDYVTKPIDLSILLARIQTQLKLKRLSQLKDEFLRIASHDLKNPLATVLLSAYLIHDSIPVGKPMTEQAHQMASFIIRRGEEMQRIVRDFLDFQAAEDGMLKIEPASIDLNAIVRSTVEGNDEYAHSKEIVLKVELDESLPIIKADPARISQVLQNFISNAIKFSPKQATTIVRTRTDTDSIFCEVSDSGPGLRDEELPRAFAKYARLSNKPTGSEHSSGLGLTICKQMIDLHNGLVGVRNNPTGGATFWFSLPLRSNLSANEL